MLAELEVDESYNFFKHSAAMTVKGYFPIAKARQKKKNLYINGKANQLKKGRKPCDTSTLGQETPPTMLESHTAEMSSEASTEACAKT